MYTIAMDRRLLLFLSKNVFVLKKERIREGRAIRRGKGKVKGKKRIGKVKEG